MATQEATEVAVAFQAAVAGAGIRVMGALARLFGTSVPLDSPEALGVQLAAAERVVRGAGPPMWELAVSFYRLWSAVTSGTVPAIGGEAPGGRVQLPTLRREFARRIRDVSPDTQYSPRLGGGSVQIVESPIPSNKEASGIVVKSAAVSRRRAEKIIEQKKQTLGDELMAIAEANRARERAGDGKPESPEENVARRITESYATGVKNVARAAVAEAATRDKNVAGWVRWSKTGTPCGFCAMLMSRGIVYKSSATAGEFSDWHDGCQCVPMLVRSLEEYQADPKFRLNRYYNRMWNDARNARSGKNAGRRVDQIFRSAVMKDHYDSGRLTRPKPKKKKK